MAVSSRLWRVVHAGVVLRLKERLASVGGPGPFRWRRCYAAARTRMTPSGEAKVELLLFDHHDDALPRVMLRLNRGVRCRPLRIPERRSLGASHGWALEEDEHVKPRQWSLRHRSRHSKTSRLPWVFFCFNADNEKRWCEVLGGPISSPPPSRRRRPCRLNDIGEVFVKVSRLDLIDETARRQQGQARPTAVGAGQGVEVPPPPPVGARRRRRDASRDQTSSAEASRAAMLRAVNVWSRRRKLREERRNGRTVSSEINPRRSSSYRDRDAIAVPAYVRVGVAREGRVVADYCSDPVTSLGADVNVATRFVVASSLEEIILETWSVPRVVETRPSDDPDALPGERRAKRIVPLHELLVRDAQRLLRPVRRELNKYLVATGVGRAPVDDDDCVVKDKRYHVYDEFHSLKPEALGGFAVAPDTPGPRHRGLEERLSHAPPGWAWYALARWSEPRMAFGRIEAKKRKMKKILTTKKKKKLPEAPAMAKPHAIVCCKIDYVQRLDELLTTEARRDLPPPEPIDYQKLVGYLSRASAVVERWQRFARTVDDLLMWRFPSRSFGALIGVAIASISLGERHALALPPLAALVVLVVTLFGRIRQEETRKIIMPPFPAEPLVPHDLRIEDADDPRRDEPRQFRPTAYLRVAILRGRNLMGAKGILTTTSDPYVKLTYRYARPLRPLAIGSTPPRFRTLDPVWGELAFPLPTTIDAPPAPRQRRSSSSSVDMEPYSWTVARTSPFDHAVGWLRVGTRRLAKAVGLGGRVTVASQMEFRAPWHRTDGGFYASAWRVPILWPVDATGALLDFARCDGRLHLEVYDADSIESGDLPAVIDELIGQATVPVSSIPRGEPWISSKAAPDGWLRLDGPDGPPASLHDDDEPYGALQVHCALELPAAADAARERRRPGRSAWAQMLTLERVLECPTRREAPPPRTSILRRFAQTYKKAIAVQHRVRHLVRLAEQLTGLVTWAQPSLTLPLLAALALAFWLLVAFQTRHVLVLGVSSLFALGLRKKITNERLGRPQPWQRGGRKDPAYKRRIANLLESLPCAPDVEKSLEDQKFAYLVDFDRRCDRAELLAVWAGALWIARPRRKSLFATSRYTKNQRHPQTLVYPHKWKLRYAAVRDFRILLWHNRDEAAAGLVHTEMIPLVVGLTATQLTEAPRVVVVAGVVGSSDDHHAPNIMRLVQFRRATGTVKTHANLQLVLAAANSVAALELKVALEREAAVDTALADIVCRTDPLSIEGPVV